MVAWNNNTEIVGLDTETFGVQRSDYPFAVSLCDDQGNNRLFEWKVNPHTRKPKIPKKDIREIQRLCRGKTIIFHNESFDLQKLELIDCDISWRNCSHDTSVISHVVNSSVHCKLQGRLKELALFYLDIPDDDQKDLRDAVVAARRIAKKMEWNRAEKDDARKDDHILRDYWLPKAVCDYADSIDPDHDDWDIFEEYADPNHPWRTVLAKYANSDTERTVLLFLLFQHIIDGWDEDDPRHEILKREQRLVNVIHDMQDHGLHLFPQKVQAEIELLESELEKAKAGMCEVVGLDDFNPRSPIQLSKALFIDLKVPLKFTSKTKNWTEEKPQYITKEEVRKEIFEWFDTKPANRSSLYRKQKLFLKSWERYQEYKASRDYTASYESLREESHIFPSIVQNGTQTTRVSSRGPNGQNIKNADPEKGIRGLRHLYGPSLGRKWFCLDYSQLQLRIFANLTEERSMIEAFEAGYDFHGFIASKIFKKDIDKVTKLERRIGKNVNFGFVFGASPRKIERTAGVAGLWDTVCKMFPSAHAYMSSVKKQVYRHGYVTTPHGYRLYVDQAHKGVNYIVQGCEGDVVKEGMLLCEDYLSELQAEGFTGYMNFQVHDELIFNFPDLQNGGTAWDVKGQSGRVPFGYDEYAVVHNLKDLMEKPAEKINMNLPVDVEVTTTDWSNTKGYELAV